TTHISGGNTGYTIRGVTSLFHLGAQQK
nr:envelope protein 2 variant 249 [Hepacivirus hominis]MOZ58078.1 envelope protein 2 variant 283 [Hepacivirus hominis]MOZ58234.1 envelope protein 2 variant 439 [Hepacivirus hominis]MOZ58482.1 envelope protein 2 variant 687 [Hepacivirus hominis]MOZ58656.1 envelope protein 2 variant 861 [Hepacivirus hominis]